MQSLPIILWISQNMYFFCMEIIYIYPTVFIFNISLDSSEHFLKPAFATNISIYVIWRMNKLLQRKLILYSTTAFVILRKATVPLLLYMTPQLIIERARKQKIMWQCSSISWFTLSCLYAILSIPIGPYSNVHRGHSATLNWIAGGSVGALEFRATFQ